MGGGGFLLTKVNARADERRRAGLRRAYFFGLQYAEWQRIAWWLRAVDGCWWRWGIVTCYMLHVTLSVRAIHGRG